MLTMTSKCSCHSIAKPCIMLWELSQVLCQEQHIVCDDIEGRLSAENRRGLTNKHKATAYNGLNVSLPQCIKALPKTENEEFVVQPGHAPAVYGAAVILCQVPVGSRSGDSSATVTSQLMDHLGQLCH